MTVEPGLDRFALRAYASEIALLTNRGFFPLLIIPLCLAIDFFGTVFFVLAIIKINNKSEVIKYHYLFYRIIIYFGKSSSTAFIKDLCIFYSPKSLFYQKNG